MTHALLNLLVVPKVPLERDDLAKVTKHTEVALVVLAAVGNHDLGTLACELAYDITTHETSATKDGRDSAVCRVTC